MHKVILHSIIEKEKDLYSALCLELDVASQAGPSKRPRKI